MGIYEVTGSTIDNSADASSRSESIVNLEQTALLAANVGSLLRNRAAHEQDQKRQQEADCG